MNKQMLASLVLLTMVLCSCEEDEYRIEMRPCGEGLERKLTVTRYEHVTGPDGVTEKVYKNVPEGTLAAISKLYPKRLDTSNPKIHSFIGTFTERMPNDVGGAGTYECLQTPMGSAFLYVERFRGNDQPGETLQETFRSADRLTDMLIGWLKSEFGGYKEFPKLRRFMDQDFRNDIKNLSTYLWLGSNESRHIWEDGDSQEKAQMEIAARAFQCLVERNYLAVDELPLIMRAGEQELYSKHLKPLIGKLLVRKVKLADQNLIAELSTLLTDPEQLARSLRDYFASTNEYKKRLKEHKKTIRETEVSNSTLEPPDPLESLEEAFRGLVHVEVSFGSDDLHVELWTTQKPVATNGKWEEQQKRLVWSTELTSRDTDSTRLPEVCYAVWCEPNEETQEKHFNDTVLLGENLLKYCLWYKSLSEEEAAEWDSLVETLGPDEDSFKRLEAFRFSDERAKPAKPSYAQQAIELIKDALEREQE